MPESSLETHELKEQLEEAVHRGSHGHGESMPKWISFLSLSTALIAVVAAVAALRAGALANEAIVAKNDAVLQESKASDKWGEYQARKIKSHIYATQAELVPAEKKDVGVKFAAEAKRELDAAAVPKSEATELQGKADESNAESSHLLHKHELFAASVTIFQVAIALSAIAALTRRRTVWFVSMVAGLLGLAFFAYGFAVRAAPARHSEHARVEEVSRP